MKPITLSNWEIQVQNNELILIGELGRKIITSKPLKSLTRNIFEDIDGHRYALLNKKQGFWKLMLLARRPKIYRLLESYGLL